MNRQAGGQVAVGLAVALERVCQQCGGVALREVRLAIVHILLGDRVADDHAVAKLIEHLRD